MLNRDGKFLKKLEVANLEPIIKNIKESNVTQYGPIFVLNFWEYYNFLMSHNWFSSTAILATIAPKISTLIRS